MISFFSPIDRFHSFKVEKMNRPFFVTQRGSLALTLDISCFLVCITVVF